MNKIFDIIIRYLIVLIIGFFGLSIFYFIFTPLTIYPSIFILELFYNSVHLLPDNMISIGFYKIQLIEACIAGSAYFLMFALNFLTPMKLATRAKNILFTFLTFLVLNIIRIVVFSSLYVANFYYFDIAHRLVWYIGSTLMVVLIWFAGIFYLKINEIPGYSDLKYIYKQSKSKK